MCSSDLHVYADLAEATSRTQYLIDCYAMPGDPRKGAYVLAVEHRESGELLGHVGFSPFHAEVEVSYAIAESARGRGYGSEALLHACQWAARTYELPSLLAITEVANASSRRMLERAGFVHERDFVMQFQGKDEAVSRYLWHASAS